MRSGFTSSDLKWIAMGTMAVDHAAVIMLHGGGCGAETAMRLAGRMAFPLYAFMLVQGFLYTRGWRKYLKRLAFLAVVSEIPFDLVAAGKAFWPQVQNTVVLLCIGLAALAGLRAASSGSQETSDGSSVLAQKIRTAAPEGRNADVPGDAPRRNTLPGNFPGGLSAALIALSAMAAAWLLNADYGALGILFVLVLYWFRYRPAERTFAGAAVLLLCEGPFYGPAAWIAFFFINRYNGEKGRDLGRLPYVFYPLHLLILYAAGVFIYGYNF